VEIITKYCEKYMKNINENSNIYSVLVVSNIEIASERGGYPVKC
jgi:hypothetical protein